MKFRVWHSIKRKGNASKITVCESIVLDTKNHIRAVKHALSALTNCTASSMDVYLRDKDDEELCMLGLQGETLGEHSPQPGYCLHAIEELPATTVGWMEDTESAAPKFTLGDEDYERRLDAIRHFKNDMTATSSDEGPSDRFLWIREGLECKLRPAELPVTVKYVGRLHCLPGIWVGIEVKEEGVGKHDGVLEGVRYFETSLPNRGLFVRPGKLEM